MDSKERLIQIKEGSGMNWKELSAYFHARCPLTAVTIPI